MTEIRSQSRKTRTSVLKEIIREPRKPENTVFSPRKDIPFGVFFCPKSLTKSDQVWHGLMNKKCVYLGEIKCLTDEVYQTLSNFNGTHLLEDLASKIDVKGLDRQMLNSCRLFYLKYLRFARQCHANSKLLRIYCLADYHFLT